MTTHRRSRKQRYAEDADYREKIRAYQRAWNAAHKDEVNAERRRSWAENPARRQQQRSYRTRSLRKAELKHYYGLSVEEHQAMLTLQRGACAICRKRPEETLCVDHCHDTQKVRSLLCRKCNLGLGHLKHDPRLLRAAIAYLEAALKDSSTTTRGDAA
jgi:hypothetical protein